MIKPMLCQPHHPFDSDDYMFEVKWDGERTILFYENCKIRLQNRRGDDVTYRYPELQELTFQGNCYRTILDGEIVVLKEGNTDFQLLAQRSHLERKFDIQMRMKVIPVTFIAFDCIEYNEMNLRNMSLYKRKDYLYMTLKSGRYQWSIPLDREGMGTMLFKQAEYLGLEGIVAKNIESTYQEGVRSKSWLKMKCRKSMDIEFNTYEINPAGVRVENEEGIAIQVAGRDSRLVKEKIDMEGSCMIEVNYQRITEGGRLFQPTYKTIKEARP